MAWNRMTARTAIDGCVHAFLLAVAMVVPAVISGCTGDSDTGPQSLDTTLVRAERLLDRGYIVEARKRLLDGLGYASGEWKGAQAGGAYEMLGDVSRQTAHLDSALLFYSKAEERYRARVQRYDAFRMVLANVRIFALMQQENEARVQAAEALRLATLFGDSAAVTEIRWALCDLYRVLEQPADMAGVAAALRWTCQRSGDLRGEARVSYLLGKAASDRGEHADAETHLLQCVALAGKAKDSALVTEALLSLARTFEKEGRIREGQEAYASALQNCTSTGTEAMLRLQVMLRVGNFEMRNTRPAVAATYYRAAADLAGSVSNAVAQGYALIQCGYTQGSAGAGEASALFRRGYDILRKIGHARGCTYALIAMGESAERENKISDATQLYRAAVTTQESAYAIRPADDLWRECEETMLGRGGADAYSAMVSVLLLTGKTQEAFWFQERCNARRLSEDLGAWNITTGAYQADSTLTNYLLQRALHIGAERQLEELASSPRGTAPLLGEIQSVLAHLNETIAAGAEHTQHADPRLAAIAHPGGIDVAQVQKVLAPDALLLMYLPARRALHACVVTQNGIAAAMASTSYERVIDLVEEYTRECALQAVGEPSTPREQRMHDQRLQDLTRSLYEALILPVESHLTPGGQLLVVLPARMPAFSLAGLRRGGMSSTPALVERMTLSYLPTARFIQAAQPGVQQVRTVAALGARGATTWDVEYELRDITAFYREARMLFGKDATLATLRSVRSDLVHLAVDVRYSVRRPLTGVMILGDGVSVEGTASVPLGEVVSLPGVRAVVVSNISGSLPAADRSLAAALLANGSSPVVLNSAPLTRKAKKVFGENFYTALQSGASVTAAVRTAQSGMARSKDVSSPAYWATIMVWGSKR